MLHRALKPLLVTSMLFVAQAALAQPSSDEQPGALEVPGGDIFGFTSPTDVGDLGDTGLAFETTTRIGKRGGTYVSPTLKMQVSRTIAPNLAFAFSPFVTGHRIRSVPDLDDRSSVRFDGFSGEVAYRFLERTGTNPLAATVSVEPRLSLVDAVTGERIRGYSAEFKLFMDAVLVPERLYGAVNLNYNLATQRSYETPEAGWQDSSGTNLSGALAFQVSEQVFVGVEARYLTAFTGAFLNSFSGHALFAGPNLLVKLSDTADLNIAWTPQIAGRASGVPARLDLDNFERHQLRVKLAFSF